MMPRYDFDWSANLHLPLDSLDETQRLGAELSEAIVAELVGPHAGAPADTPGRDPVERVLAQMDRIGEAVRRTAAQVLAGIGPASPPAEIALPTALAGQVVTFELWAHNIDAIRSRTCWWRIMPQASRHPAPRWAVDDGPIVVPPLGSRSVPITVEVPSECAGRYQAVVESEGGSERVVLSIEVEDR